MAHDLSNINLYANSAGIAPKVRIVKSKKKETAINASPQIPEGAITVVVSYGNTHYVKITDGNKKFSDLKKIGEGEDSGPVTWDSISDKPDVIGAGATQSEARTALGLGSSATTPSTAYATSAQGAKADSAVQPSDLSNFIEKVAEPTSGRFASLTGDGNIADSGWKGDDFATSAQGDLADTAVQPADIPQAVQDWLLGLTGGTTAGNVLAVNSTGDGFEFITPA